MRVYLTGGTSGIGRACVERLRADGADVVFSGRNDARGKAVAKATGARFIRCDLTDRAAADKALDTRDQAPRRPGRAGAQRRHPLPGLDRVDARRRVPRDRGDERDGASSARPAAPGRRWSRTARRWSSSARTPPSAASTTSPRTPSPRRPSAPSRTSSPARAPRSACGSTASARATSSPACRRRRRGTRTTPRTRPSGCPRRAGASAQGEDVARLVAWLVGPESTHVNGATIRIDGGMGAVFQAASRAE